MPLPAIRFSILLFFPYSHELNGGKTFLVTVNIFSLLP